MIAEKIVKGEVIPFLGAGASRFGRPEAAPWERGRYLPGGQELADHLAKRFNYESPSNTSPDLPRVSQYAEVLLGSEGLFQELHQVFDADYPIPELHQFLAGLPSLSRRTGHTGGQLFVTANYDDLLERALIDAGETFDLLTYESEDVHRGNFWHWTAIEEWPPRGERRLVEVPNAYAAASPYERTVVLKVHGAVDRRSIDGNQDSFVITEDHYLDYLLRVTELSSFVPVLVARKLCNSYFLFLGYGLRDWNLRVILKRIWRDERLTRRSWAVQDRVEMVDNEFWSKKNVQLFAMRLEEFVVQLKQHVAEFATAAPEA